MISNKIVFQSLSSGSCGNCYFLHMDGEEGGAGIIIDAGVSMRRLKMELLKNGFSHRRKSIYIRRKVYYDHGNRRKRR